MRRLFFFTGVLVILSIISMDTSAQNITPISGGCSVQPMPWDHIMQLVEQAAASPTSDAALVPVSMPSGSPVDEATLTELDEVIDQMQACSHAQDLPRLLSLYTDRLIVDQFFATEPIQIIVTELGTPTETMPAPIMPDQQQFIMEAVLLPDGRIAAKVSGNAWGGNPRLYIFAQHDGKWLIDEIEPMPDTEGTNMTIPATAITVVDLVRNDAARQLGVAPSSLEIGRIEAVDWPDSSLGCPQSDGVYAPVISPGYRIIVTDGAQTFEYHTGPNNLFVRCTEQ